ncbi:uncharacterized protein [Hyperolius riggenbachi]|uniref:uncharacterized protein isoform X2 n=1 Tax=Hyperolius riggenbachi TaxID=752182 RepID=UPI0035A27009
MMTFLGYENILILVFCMVCKAQGDDSYQTLVLSTSPSASLPVLKSTYAFTETDEPVYTIAHTEQPEIHPTHDPGFNPELLNSNLSPISHHLETSPAPRLPESANSETSDASEETNSIDDIFTADEKLFNLSIGTASPEVENTAEDLPTATTQPATTESQVTPYEETEADALLKETSDEVGDNQGNLGLEPWKIGVISVAVFLALEAIVLTIYCFTCKRRRSSGHSTIDGTKSNEQQEGPQRRGDMPERMSDNKSTTV